MLFIITFKISDAETTIQPNRDDLAHDCEFIDAAAIISIIALSSAITAVTVRASAKIIRGATKPRY